MAKITFRFEDKSLETKVIDNVDAGLTIQDVTEDHHIHLNHNCGCVCACSTCHVYIDKGEDYLQEITDREEDFIDRAIDPRIESRLGCQCVILDNEAEIEVTIPDQSQIIGHEH
jgi:2Fe-2S ferredoxin